jgi:hypothetical protein
MAKAHEEHEVVTRVYEAGYHVVPTVAEGDVEKVVASIRSVIEKLGGHFIAEGAPSLLKLAGGYRQRKGAHQLPQLARIDPPLDGL